MSLIKKYKNSLCLMKAYPPTLGHLHLIDTAIRYSEKVHVMVCHNKNQWIPGDIRVSVLSEIYQNNPDVIIYSVEDDGIPQHDSECKTLDEFYRHWVPLVYSYINQLDAVFTSEDYGDDFARYLGVEHFLVDKKRQKYSVSGTEVRDNPFKYWSLIPKNMHWFFVKKIALMGPESVGKSVLSKKLADYYQTNFVEEYGRTVYENNGNKISIDDFVKISIGRQSIEDRLIKSANKLLFCDTEDITTYIFSKMFYPEDYIKVESFLLGEIDRKKKYDLYILLKPDCQFIQDGTRCFPNERWDHYYTIKRELQHRLCNFIEIGGNWDQRLLNITEIINSNYKN